MAGWGGAILSTVGFIHYMPSICVLGQWTSLRSLKYLPGTAIYWRTRLISNCIALTFDDGPSLDTTPSTLDLLDELGLKATFFVLGEQVSQHGDLVLEIVRRGHSIALHGYSHEPHQLHSPKWIRNDLSEAIAELSKLGISSRWYRPTYGQLTMYTLIECHRQGLQVVLWSVWGREWTSHNSDKVLGKIIPHLHPGEIILLHDNDVSCPYGTAAKIHAILPLLADELHRRKLRTATLDDLYDAKRDFI